MRKRVLAIILTLCILLAVPAALCGLAFGLPAQYDETYLAALPAKLERLRSAPSPRVILIGGSGTAFDVRSDLLEQELPGYTVINFGLYAGLGTSVMLDLAEPYLLGNDVVVFLPEQNAQSLSNYFDATSLWQATDGAVPWLSLNSTQRGAMIGAFPKFAGSKARLFWEGSKPIGDAIYARRSFNAFGDISCPGRLQNVMPGGADANFPVSFDPALPAPEFLARINDFDAVCRKKGASLYFGFCPMNAASVTDTFVPAEYVSMLSDSLTCEILMNPEDSILDPEWFFDTNFHLNEAGQILFTATLARCLKPICGIDTPMQIDVPDAPTLAQPSYICGNDRDADCFTYRFADETAIITGLTARGMQSEHLILPAFAGDVPVTGMDSDALRDADRLRTLTLGPNLRSLPDGAFSGCSALERVILTNEKPGSLQVGVGLLDGTNAMLVVPAASFSTYATHYFWSIYSDRMMPE